MVGLGIGAPNVQVYHEKSFILPDVSRVLACLYEKGVKFETCTASYKSLLRLQASSHAPVPFYDGPTFLEESREICRYIAEKYEHQGYPFLLGKDALERASVEEWLHNEEHAFNPPSRALFCHLAFPPGEEEDDGIDMHMMKLEEVLEVYDQRLSDSEFLVGNKFTLADLVHLPNSHYIKASDKFLHLYDSRKNVRRWWDAISNQDSWKKVLRYMKTTEEQNKQEELKKQQEEEDPRTSAESIPVTSAKRVRTKPRSILVPPKDTVSSSSIVPRTKKPLPSDTSSDEILISSSHSPPAAYKTSAVQSKEITIFTNPQETPPTSVQSTPVTSKKHSIPVQSTKHATSPTTAKKPSITDAAKSSTKDASILESSSSKDVSSNLDVFDHYPSHTDVDTPYIEPTTRKTSETLDAFSGSNIGTGYTKTSSISAREEPDHPTASDFYKSESTGTSVDSRFKESVPYSGRTPPELEPTDTSASKLHTTDVHRRLQVEQWHSAKTGLNDLKHDDADHLVSTQQGKPRKDVQQYPSQDSEQATSHSVPQEPMSRDVLSQLEDYASSDQRGALLPPSTQEHGVTPSRQAEAKDARRRISSQAAYPGGQDTSKQPRDHGSVTSVPRQGEPQDAREIFHESQAPDSAISSERFSYTSQSSLPRQDLDGAHHAIAPFETRYPGAEDTSKQAKDKISNPWQMTDHDTGDVKEETKVSESSSFQMQPSYFERADAPSQKQETIDDTFKETRYHSVAPPSQTRYQTPPSKARYPTAEDARKQPRGTAATPKKKSAQDYYDTSEEAKTADEVTSTEQPLDTWRSPVSPRRQNVEDSSRSDTSFQKRYPYDEEDIQVANSASVSWQLEPDGDKNIFEETKLPDSTPTSAKPVYTPRAPFPPPRQAEVKDAKDKGRQSRITIPESQKMVSGDAQTTHGERKTGTPGEQSSDRLQAIPQSRLPAAKGLSTKEEITNEQTVVPPLLSNEPTSRVQPASEFLQEAVASRGGLSTRPSTIEQWHRATVPLNDTTSTSGDGEIGAETPGVQSASPSFPGASTARHATSDDKFARKSIIDERVGEPTKMIPTPYSAPAHTKRETPDGHEIVDSEFVSTPDGHISEAAKIRQDRATVHEDVHDANLSAHDVAQDTFKEAKVAESTPSSAKPMYPQQPAPTPRHAEAEDTWEKGMKGRETVPDRQQMLGKWAGTAREQVSDRWKASPPSRQPAAEDVRGATGDTVQFPDVLDTSKKSRGAYEEAKGPGSVKEEKTSSIYQKKPLVAQGSQEQAQTVPAGEKADGSIRKHQQASDVPITFVEKLDASEPARIKIHGDFSAEKPYRKDTTDDQKVAPPLSTRELTSQVQPPSERSYDAALHRDLSSKPSTIYQWQRSSAPLHDVTSSSGDEVAKSTVDEKPTPMSQQKSDEQRAEPPVPIEAEISDVQHASPSFPGASMDDRATIDNKFAMQSIIDQRVGEPTQMQTSSPDAHPASEPTKRGTHEIGHLELVSTPGVQISEAKKARDDPARADIHDGHSAEEQYKKYTVDDQKVASSLSSKEPASQVQPASEPLQRAVPDGDLPSKSFTIDQWQRTAAPLHGVITDSGDDEEDKSSNNDQKTRLMSQEATPSSQSVNQMAKQSGEQRVEPPVPIVAEASDVVRAAPSLPEAARTDGATISDKFTDQSNIDERVGKPKQMQAPITAARPDSAPTLRRTPDSHEAGELVSTPEGQRLEGAKATRDPARIHKDVYDASLSTDDAAIDEKTAMDHASGDEVVTGSLHDQQAPGPASIQAQPTFETPHDSDSFQYVHTGDSGKAELVKPTVTDQEAAGPAAGPTSADLQHADTIPAGVAHSEQKSTPSDKGSGRAAQHPSPVEPIKADSNVSAANYTNAPQMIFRQQARPPTTSTIAIQTPDAQGVIGKIQEVTPDNRGTDDSGKPSVPNQEHVSHASEAIPGQEEMTSPQGARVFPTSDTQLSSADVHEVTPDDQQTVESITPLVSSGKQGSHVRSPFKPGEVGPAEKKFAPSDEESPHSSEESISGEPRKEQTVIPTAKQTTAQPTIIGRQDIPDRKQALTSEDTLNSTAIHDDVYRTGTIEPARRPLSVEGEELTPATQAPSPSVARDSFHTELENVQSVKPSATPDARNITPSSAPGEAALAEQKSASSGQGAADPAQPAFSLGPRNEKIRYSSPMVAVRDQAKDSQTTPGQQDILSTEHPSRKVQENIPGDNLGKAKPSRPSSAIQEGKPSKASALGIHLVNVPNELTVDEQKFAPPGQDSAYLARPPSSAEPRSKEIGDLAPSTQLNSTTDPRNKDTVVAAPGQTTDSQTTPGRQVKFSAPSSQGPLGKLQENEPADDLGEKKSSKPPSVVREGKPAAAVPISAPDTQHGAAPDQVAVEQKFSPSGQDTVHSVQTSFTTEPTKEDTVVAPTDQTSTLERTVDQNYITTAADKAKTPFSGTPDASRKTQKSIEDDHIDEKLPSQGQVSPDRHVSESPQGRSPEAHTDVVDKETTLGSSETETSKTGPGSTSISADGRLSSSDMPAAGSLPETQDLQDSASAQNVLTDSLGKIESPGHVSTDQAVAPTMSPSLPSVAPLGTVPGTNSVQLPQQASTTSTVDLESVPDTQNGIPLGKTTPGEQKSAISDQEPAHTTERPSSTEPRKEEANTAAGDQPNVTQGPETTVQHQAKAPPPDSRKALKKYQQPSHAVLPSDIRDGPTPVRSAVIDKETTQTSVSEPNLTPTHGDVLPTRSVQNQEAQPPPATQAPTSQGLQDSVFSQNDSSENIKSPRQASTDQIVAPAINSAAPTGAPQGTEPGPNSSQYVQSPFFTEPTKEDTVVTAADQAEDMQTITHQQTITPALDTAKPPFPGTQDALKFQESTPDDGLVETYSPKPGAQTKLPAPTLDVSLYASSKTKPTGQGAKQPTGYQASSPETQLGSSQTQGEAAPAKQKFAVSDEKSVNPSKSFASAKPREEDTDAAIADQTSVPPRQFTSSTPDASDALSRDQESSPDDDRIRNLGSPLIASQEDASRAGRASEGSTPIVHSAVVDEKRIFPSSQAQTSSTGPDSGHIGGDAHLSGAGMPATSSMEKQEAEPPQTTQAPTSMGLQDTGNIESPRQTSTDQTVTPAMNSAAPSNAPEGTEPGPDSSRSVQTPFSTETAKEDTIVTAANQAEDMQKITQQQAITPAPDTAKPPFPGAQDASRKFQESIPHDGPADNYSSKPAAQTLPPAETLDVSPDALSKAKSTGQGSKPPTGYQASSPETQLVSSQTQGEAAPAEQKIAVTDEKYVNPSKSFASAKPMQEDIDAAIADQTSVPPTNVTHQITSSTPDASEALSRDQESSAGDGRIRNLGRPLIASQEDASRAGHASEGSTPIVHSAAVDEKRTLPSSQARTSSIGPDSGQIGGDARLSGADMPATSSMEKHEAEPPQTTQAPTSKGLQDTGIESPRQTSTDQTVAPGMISAAPSDAPEPGPDSSRSVQTPFSTETAKEDTIVIAANQAEDMQKITQQQAITPTPDTAKPPFPGAQDASRKFQDSIPDDGPAENYSSKPAAQTLPPAETLDVSPDALNKAKSTGQGSKPPTVYQASSPETKLGSSQTQGEAAPAEEKFAVTDEKSVNPSKSFASAKPRKEDTDASIADQTSVPPRQFTSSTPDSSDALSRDQESSPDDDRIRNLGSPLIASQEDASRAGRASEGSTPIVHSAVVDEKRTLPSSQAQTSSTGPDSGQIGGDAHLSGAGMPATSSMEKQEAEPPQITQAPTSKGLQDTGIESPRQTSTDQTMAPGMISAAPSDAPEPGPDSSRSVQTPFSTETTKEDTIVTAANQAEDVQKITQQQAITPAPDTAKPPFPGAQDASRKFQESIPHDGPADNYSSKPAAQTLPPAETLDVSPDALSKAKSTGQGSKPPTGYQASSPETQLVSSQTQGEAAPAEQKIAVTDEKSVNPSKSFASAKPREEDIDATVADQTSVPPTNVTSQITSSTPNASDALSRDQEFSPDDGRIRNLGSPLIAGQEDASRAGHASEGSTPIVHSATVDEKRTLPSSQAQTSSTGPDSGQIGGDARLSGTDMPATSSMEKHEAEPPQTTQAPTSKGLQDTGIESPRQTSTGQTVAPRMISAAPSDAPEPGPDSSRSVQTPFSTETTKEDTIVTAADQAEDMQTITQQQAITPAPDTAKPPFPGAQDASRKFQESIPHDGPADNYSSKPAAQTLPPAETLDVSPDALSKAKSTGQGSKPPIGYQASSPETLLGSSQTQGEGAPAEQKFAVTDEKYVNPSKSFASAKPREEDIDAAIAGQTSVPLTNVTRQVTNSTPDASDALSRDQQSSPDNGRIRNLGSPLIASQEDASRAGRASEGSTPIVHSAVVDEIRTLPSSQAQISSTGPDSAQIGGDARLSGDMPATSPMEKLEAEPSQATQGPTSKGLQDTGNIESPRQTSTDQTMAPAMNSAAPSDAPEGTESGPDSSRSVQTPFSTETTKEDTIVTADDHAEDMQTIAQQEAITPAPDTAKPPFPGAQDASRKFQESIPDDGPVENYSSKPAAQTLPPAETIDVSPDALSKAKSTGQGSKPPTGYQASSPETLLGSSQTQGEGAPAEQKFAVTDEKYVNPSKSFASAKPREEDIDAAIAGQTSVPSTNVTRQVTNSTPDASDALSRDQQSSPDDGRIRNLGSPLIASQEDASCAGRASEGSTPIVHSAVVDEIRTLPSSQAQISSTGPDSAQIGGDARLSGDMPATSPMEKLEAEPSQATQGPTSKGLQDTGNIESPRQTSTDQTVAPAMNSAAPSDAPEGTESGPDSSRSVQTPFSTETTKEDTIVTAADQAEDMQTITQQQAITHAPDTAKPPFPGAQDASRKFQDSIPDDGPAENYSSKPAAQTLPSAETLDVSPDALNKAKSTGQGSKPPTVYPASSPETQLGSSQTQGEAAPAEEKFAVTDEKSVNPSKSFASAKARKEDTDASIADQTSVPPRQFTNSTPNASDALSRDQESSPDDDRIRNLGSPLIASQEDASLAGRASEGSTPIVHSAVVDEKRTLPSSQAQTSSIGPHSGQIGGDARLSGAGMPATSSMEKQEAEPPQTTQAPTFMGLQDTGNIESPRQTSTDHTVTPAMNSAAPSNAAEGTESGPDSSRAVHTPFSTEPKKEDTIVTAADVPRSSEESMVQLQSEDNTQGRGTDAPSLEAGHPSNGGLPANSNQNNTSQSQAEASNKSIEQSSDIWNKDSDSSRLDDSTDPTKPET